MYHHIIDYICDRFHLGESVQLDKVAESCAPNLTGADFYALCSDAFMCAMKEYIAAATSPPTTSTASSSSSPSSKLSRSSDSTPVAFGDEVVVVVEQRHFLSALQRLKPSVSFSELNYYRKLQEKFCSKGK